MAVVVVFFRGGAGAAGAGGGGYGAKAQNFSNKKCVPVSGVVR